MIFLKLGIIHAPVPDHEDEHFILMRICSLKKLRPLRTAVSDLPRISPDTLNIFLVVLTFTDSPLSLECN